MGCYTVILLLGMMLPALQAFGHGMDLPGPHGGFIRMPGAFHTELLATSENDLKVYLLDVEFKNPVTRKSKVDGYLKRKDQKKDLACATAVDHFACKLPNGLKLQLGDEIILKANRQGMTGGLSIYRYPFKLSVSGGK